MKANFRRPEILRTIRLILLAMSSALLIGVSLCFFGRWDAVAVVTLPPFWAWGILGIAAAALACRLARGRGALSLLAIWFVAVPTMSDDISALFWPRLKRFLSRTDLPAGRRIRVVSLNCASQASAAAETAKWNPDIVLLQESPSSNDVVRLCREWFGSEGNVLYGLDCTIVARGQIQRLYCPRSLRFTWGKVRFLDGFAVDVVSLRLNPPDIRFDLWSPECWRQHRSGRQHHRAQMQELLDSIAPVLGRSPFIVGGDFNASAGDAIFRPIDGPLRDTFRQAGRGWGNTAINTCPIARIDQIWASPSFAAIWSVVQKTDNSDHRMVICELAR